MFILLFRFLSKNLKFIFKTDSASKEKNGIWINNLKKTPLFHTAIIISLQSLCIVFLKDIFIFWLSYYIISYMSLTLKRNKLNFAEKDYWNKFGFNRWSSLVLWWFKSKIYHRVYFNLSSSSGFASNGKLQN